MFFLYIGLFCVVDWFLHGFILYVPLYCIGYELTFKAIVRKIIGGLKVSSCGAVLPGRGRLNRSN